jgi:2TM domain
MNTPNTLNTSNSPSDDEITRRAKKRVDTKMGFYVHLTVFICVNLGLLALNAAQGGYRWSIWPLGGWAIGLAIHGIVTVLSLRGEGFRERMLAQEIERLKGRR